ncbi:hypothetical protein BFD15_02675 [Morganella morganii]|nr:hypothetical protein BFD15_02675 [Morganella morganii]
MNLLNHPLCKGRIPGSIHQYVTGVAERSQHSHRPEDETDKSAKSFVSQEGGKEKSPGSIHQYVTRGFLCSQRVCGAKDEAD